MEQYFSGQSFITDGLSSTNITREIEIHLAESETVNVFATYLAYTHPHPSSFRKTRLLRYNGT